MHNKTNFNGIILIFITALFISSCHTKDPKVKPNSTFVMSDKLLSSSTFATAKQSTLKNELSFFGEITVDNNKLVEVYPIVGGNVIKVFVGLGDYVQKDQVLASIRSTEVAGFERDLEDAQSDYIVAKNNYKVNKELFEGKLNTEHEMIEAKGLLDKAAAQLHRMQTTFKIYNLKPGAIYDIKAPISGFIIQKNINQDMLLRNDKSDNIFDIAQINEVWAIANVSESDISKVNPGINAEISTLSYPNKKFYGKVDKLFNVIDPETKAMKARVRLQNDSFLLKPDMRATIKLSYSEDKKMIAIPSTALIFDKSKYFVIIFKDRNNIESRQVELYRQVGDTSYIEEGLKENEKVITNNQILIYNALND